ncbi:uncharacterized protein LOC132548599 [Ylistrum balloti]|uniref:uncharacterized protein LOC132548599 n=1 Tax=Ylistrum balloti TaxID=509963 RepID=UPI002905BA6A|nr:uncharacterized protein LOC132548599 [Ylistrum balloti]
MDLDTDAVQSFHKEEPEKDDLECDLCKISYSQEQEFRDHAWSLMHHINIEKKKKGSTHNCTLCFASCPNIIEYGKHLNGEKHKRAAEGQRRQKEKETMTFQKEALLNKRVQDDMLPVQLDNEGNLSDPELSRHFKSARHGKSHQRSSSQPYIKGKGKSKSFKGKGPKLDDKFSSHDMPSFYPRERNTDFHEGDQNHAFWENKYNANWESGGFVQPSDHGFHSQSNWDTSWWDENNMNSQRDELSFYPRYQTRNSQDWKRGNSQDWQRGNSQDWQHGNSQDWQHGNSRDRLHGNSQDRQRGNSQDRQRGNSHERQRGNSHERQRGKNKQSKGITHNRWNRRDNSNERNRYDNQEEDPYWRRGSHSNRYHRDRHDHSWDHTTEEYSVDNRFEQPNRDFQGHMAEPQQDLSIDNDMTGQKRRCTSEEKSKSKSRKKTVNFDNSSQRRKNSVEMDSDSRVSRDSGLPDDIHLGKQRKETENVVQSALEPDSTTEEMTLDKKTNKGKKKEKSKKKKGSSVKPVGDIIDHDDQRSNNVLEQAEQLCKELRDKRQLVKKEREKKERQKKMEKANEINSQIKNLSKINQSYLRGHIAGCEEQIPTVAVDSDKLSKPSLVRTKTQKEHDIDDIRKGIESVVNAGKQSMKEKEGEKDSDLEGKSSKSNHEPVINKKSSKGRSDKASVESELKKQSSDEAQPHDSQVTKTSVSEQESSNPMRIGTFSPLHQESLSRQSSRASSDLSTDLDPESSKDTLLKMVNSPRSRKEREKLAKMLRSYAFSQNKLSFPRFNLQLSDLSAELDGVATELRLENLSADVQLQIAELIEADIKPDISSLDAFLLETQKSTCVDQEQAQSPNVNKILSNTDIVPTQDLVDRNKLQDPKSSPSMKLAVPSNSPVREKAGFHHLNSPADKGTSYTGNPLLCIKSEELSEPEQDVSLSEPAWAMNKSNGGKSKVVLSVHKSQNKHLKDTSEPVSLKDTGETDYVSSQFSVPVSKSQSESLPLQVKSEPVQPRNTSSSLEEKESLECENPRSRTDFEPSKYISKSVVSGEKLEFSVEKSLESRNTAASCWSKDKLEPVWGGEMSELSLADLSSTPLQAPSQDLGSTKQPVGSPLLSKNSYIHHRTWPSIDVDKETITGTKDRENSGTARTTESGPVLGKGSGDTAALVSVNLERSGRGKLDLDQGMTGKVTNILGPRVKDCGESVSQTLGHDDDSKPAVGIIDPTNAAQDETFAASGSSSTSGSVFDLVYDLSLEEDSLRQEMTSTESEIMRLTALIQTATEQLSTQRTRHLQLSRKEQSIRSRRLHVLREAKSLQNLPMDIAAKSVERLCVATSDDGPERERAFMTDSCDLDSSRDSNFTKVSALSSFSHDQKGAPKNGNVSDSLLVLSDSSDSSGKHKGMGGFSSPLSSQRINPAIFQALPPPLQPTRDSEGFIEPNKHTLKTFESTKEASRTTDRTRDGGKSAVPTRDIVSSGEISKDNIKSFKSEDKDVQSYGPNRGTERSVDLIKDSKSSESSKDCEGLLEQTKDTSGVTKSQFEIGQSVSVVGSAELKESGFITLKSLLRASNSEGIKPVKEQERSALTTDDQISSGAVSSTTVEFTQPRLNKVAENTQPKVNVQYMGQLPGNLFTGQKEDMFEKLQSFLKSSKSDQGYRSESSLKSDEIVLETDSNQDSVASNVSLGEKIRQYCKENRRDSTQLDSGSDHTLKGSNSEANMPDRQQSKPPVSPSVSDDRNSSPSRKRRKTKKERDLSSKRKQKEEFVINSSSECSGQDDDNIPLTELRQRMLFQRAPEELEDVCMVETGSEDGAAHVTVPRRSLLEDVQLDSTFESEENVHPVRSQRFKLGPERLASVRAAVKSTIARSSDKGRIDDSIKQLVGPADSVTQIQVAGESVFVAYQKSNPCRFNLESGALLGQYDCSPCCVRSLAVVTIDKKLCMYACGPSERLFLFDCETYAILKDMELIYQVQCMHESWGRLYLGTDYGAVIGKDAKTGKTFESFQCCDQSVTCIASGLEGVRKILLVAAYTSPIYVCDAISGLLLRMLEGHSKTVFCMEVVGHMVYSGSGDRKVIEHNLLTSEVSWSYGEGEGLVRGVTTDKQGHLFYGGQDQYIRCYNRQNHQLYCLFYVGKSPVLSNIVTQKDKILYGNKEGVVEMLTMETNPNRCQCGDCSYSFGLKGHLFHHMVSDHLSLNSRLFNCPWKGCTNRLSTYQSSKEAEEHLKEHLERQ